MIIKHVVIQKSENDCVDGYKPKAKTSEIKCQRTAKMTGRKSEKIERKEGITARMRASETPTITLSLYP